MKKRFSEEQIIGFLREVKAGLSVKDRCRRVATCPSIARPAVRLPFGRPTKQKAPQAVTPARLPILLVPWLPDQGSNLGPADERGF